MQTPDAVAELVARARRAAWKWYVCAGPLTVVVVSAVSTRREGSCARELGSYFTLDSW